jgi:AcrR family transcriptional regulator
MPKRIPHLAEAIVDQAALLFSAQGYDAVDMKQVAAEAGTSVGNLYNYFPSKPALFLAIMERWRNLLVEACEEILAGPLPRREKIFAVLGRLYDDISRWHGLWREFLGGREERHLAMDAKMKRTDSGMSPWGMGPKALVFLTHFEELLTGKPEPKAHRWSFIVISATLQLASRYPDDREQNWKTLETLVDRI